MKKLIFLALIALVMVWCLSDQEKAKIYEKDSFAVLTFDSCEYVFKTAVYRGFLAHKGNCKYCAERRKQEIRELINELKEK